MPRLLEQETSTYYNLDISIYPKKVSWNGLFHSSKEAPQLELKGDVQALSKSEHAPQVCKNKSRGSCVFLHTSEVQMVFSQSTLY